MPRAEPALSRAPLHLPAVVGAATLRGGGSPHPLRLAARRRKAADSPLKGVLRASAGRVSCPHPLRLAARRRKAADTGRVPWGQGAVPGQPPSGYPGESPGVDLVYYTLTATTPHTANDANDSDHPLKSRVKGRFTPAQPEGEKWRGGRRLSPRL